MYYGGIIAINFTKENKENNYKLRESGILQADNLTSLLHAVFSSMAKLFYVAAN